jgi:Zn-dependent M28 family amino/carboxypeptidase
LACTTSRAAVVVALFAALGLSDTLVVDLADKPLVRSRLESGAVALRQRQATIVGLFRDAGCSAEEQRVDKNFGNVICTLPGQTNSVIAVGGHTDFVEEGTGIVDDWSGASLLPSLYQALKSRPRQHTFVFVGFAAEERGLVGSSRYVKNLTPEQRKLIHAFVNLECLGLTTVNVWVSRSTPALVARLRDVAKALDIPLHGVDVDNVGDDDTHPFVAAHIPVVSIHSVTQETFPILHTKRDRMDAIHFDDYYAAYKLAAYYLAYLDVKTD